MANIREAIEQGAPDLALQFSKQLLRRVQAGGGTIDELSDRDRVLCDLHSAMGSIYFEMDKLSLALVHHRKDSDLARQAGLAAPELRGTMNLARTYQAMNKRKQAITLFTSVTASTAPRPMAADAFLQLGRLCFDLGDYQLAGEHGNSAVKLLRASSASPEPAVSAPTFASFPEPTSHELELDALCMIGRALFMAQDVDGAHAALDECLKLSQEYNDFTAQAAALTNLAVLARRADKSEEAAELQRRADEANARAQEQ
jgi:tetratricopeptide (TPR) repeat protein